MFKKFVIINTLICALCLSFMLMPQQAANAADRYEYKIVALGSLTSMQSKDKSQDKAAEVESILNNEGQKGWELVNIFAVRTTFDPNVFYAVMKREVAK